MKKEPFDLAGLLFKIFFISILLVGCFRTYVEFFMGKG